jgi:hypothetical protein
VTSPAGCNGRIKVLEKHYETSNTPGLSIIFHPAGDVSILPAGYHFHQQASDAGHSFRLLFLPDGIIFKKFDLLP